MHVRHARGHMRHTLVVAIGIVVSFVEKNSYNTGFFLPVCGKRGSLDTPASDFARASRLVGLGSINHGGREIYTGSGQSNPYV